MTYTKLGALDLQIGIPGSQKVHKLRLVFAPGRGYIWGMSSVYIFLRKDVKRVDGKSSLYIRFLDDDKRKADISLRISINYDDWDNKRCEVRKGGPDAKEINARLKYHLGRAQQILLEAEFRRRRISVTDFKELFTKNGPSRDFLTYVREDLEKNAHLFSHQTVKYYKGQISKLEKFSSRVKIDDINLSFIRGYEKYMIQVLGNQKSTYSKSLSWVKVILNRAIRDGIIDRNPFDNYKLSRPEGKREFLTIEEVRDLELLYMNGDLPAKEKNVLRYFLFSVFTGLRYQDVRNLRTRDVSEGYVRITMNKTMDEVLIPLTDKAKRLMPEKKPDTFKIYVFDRVLSNQKTNDNLKVIMKKAGIDKSISFHCARHTFATVGITLGIPIEVISRLLGHRSIKTTQIYAKVIDAVKFREMKKWEAL